MRRFRIYDNENQQYIDPGTCWVNGLGVVAIQGTPYSPEDFAEQTRFVWEDSVGWLDNDLTELYIGDVLHTTEMAQFGGEFFTVGQDERGDTVLESTETRIMAKGTIFNHFTKIGTIHDTPAMQVAA